MSSNMHFKLYTLISDFDGRRPSKSTFLYFILRFLSEQSSILWPPGSLSSLVRLLQFYSEILGLIELHQIIIESTARFLSSICLRKLAFIDRRSSAWARSLFSTFRSSGLRRPLNMRF